MKKLSIGLILCALVGGFFSMRALVPLRVFAGSFLKRYVDDYARYYKTLEPTTISSFTDPALDFSFISILYEFIDKEAVRLANERCWVPGQSGELEKFFGKIQPMVKTHFNANSMVPWAQKKIVVPGSSLHFVGDLHGDMRSLLLFLLDLNKQGILHDDYTLEPGHYIVFLGDYVDRGPYSLDVLAMVLFLKIKNPEYVIALRGNHEEHIAMISESHIPSLVNMIIPGKGEPYHELLDSINKAYNLLPCVLFIGVQNDGSRHMDYIMCAHAGVEVAYDPHALLVARDSCQYELILWSYRDWAGTNKRRALNASRMLNTKVGIETFRNAGYGHLWADVPVCDDTAAFGSPVCRLVFGKRVLTAAFDTACSGIDAKMHMLIRGHQHRVGLLSTVFDSMVYTVVSCAQMLEEMTGMSDDFYMEGAQSNTFGTSYLSLMIDKETAGWRLIERHVEYNAEQEKIFVRTSPQKLPDSVHLSTTASRHAYECEMRAYGFDESMAADESSCSGEAHG